MDPLVASFLVGAVPGVLAALAGDHQVVPRRRTGTVIWDPSRRQVDGTPGPLVYCVRAKGTDRVKIGYTGATTGARVEGSGGWLTGMVEEPVFEAIISPGPKDLERKLHRVFRRERINARREWFQLPADGDWRARLERAVGG